MLRGMLSPGRWTVFMLSAMSFAAMNEMPLHYPAVRTTAQTDSYHGTPVPDPYRWLEDDHSEETKAWVRAENEVTAQYLKAIPYRDKIYARLRQLQNYPRYTSPFRKGGFYFFTKNDGLQNQNVVYVQEGLNGAPRLLLDPNRFSADGTSRLGEFSVSKDGTYAAYTISTGGSDWQEGHVLEVATGKVLPDELKWLKLGGIGWAGNSFFYSRYPAPQPGQELSSKNEGESVYLHHVGTVQANDELVYEDKAHPQRFHFADTTYDEHYVLLTIADRGQGKDGNALYFRDLTRQGSPFVPINADISDDQYGLVEEVGGKFLIQTNAHAPNSRVAEYDPQTRTWRDIIRERPQPLLDVAYAGGKLLAGYSEDVASRLYVYSMEGTIEREIPLPSKGIVASLSGDAEDPFAFFQFTSLNVPQTIYQYDLRAGSAKIFHASEVAGYNPSSYETNEVFYQSKDGTRVPMFLVHRKGLKLDGANPTLLYAYGGFNVVNAPVFNPLTLALLEQGFVFASANIRGGGEYGDSWHHAGMRLQKQNVFDDFIAAAQWLVSNRYTSPEKLAIHGVSNGGLLVGAVINQRPDLCRVAIAQAGVMDMLRFQKFTIGWNWAADYGSSDDPQSFKYLLAYSPLHNIKDGVKYPATLVTTADHDDRVVPGHSFKYAATLQAKANPANPVLIRIDTNSGHGPSSTTKRLEQTADIYAFLFQNVGVSPKFEEVAAR